MNDEDAILDIKQRRLRKLVEQQALYGPGGDPHIAIQIEDLQREIAALTSSGAASALPRPPQPDFVHPYPIQASFTGRVSERKMLTEWLSQGTQPVLGLIAIGGMGKSALSWAWVQRDVLGLPLPGATSEPSEVTAACRLSEATRPEGVLWWSFYETQASFGAFLDEAIGYAGDRKLNPRELPSNYDKVRALLGLLQQRRLLLVLDGFERELRAYASLGAAYQGDAVEKESGGQHRVCTDPHAGRFLRDAATLPLKSRVLLTSRLFPRELDDLGGCERKDLVALDPEDAVVFFQQQGIRGTRAEIQTACMPYGYHALALRLLAGVVKKNRRNPGDIKAAGQYPVLPELKGREQHHILQVAYDQLDRPKRALLSRLAALRSPMPYDALAALNNYTDSDRFDRALNELEERGLLFFDREQARYDMHPVVRSYAYDRLGDKTVVHTRLRVYFVALPEPDNDKAQSVDNLMPAIELYHHTARAGRYDEAFTLFRDRLGAPLYFRLGAYQTCIELLTALFPDGEERPPRLKDESTQGWTLNALANSYSLSGRSRRAVLLKKRDIAISEKQDDKVNTAIGLTNLAIDQIRIGGLRVAEHNLRRSIELCREIGHEFFDEAIGHHELGRLLAYYEEFGDSENELAIGLDLFHKSKASKDWVAKTWAYRSRSALFRNDTSFALECAVNALEFSTKDAQEDYPVERDFIIDYWLLGMAYQELRELTQAQHYLTESLTRCRRINLIEMEPDILLAWAKWHHLQGNLAQARADADEALSIADRCEYRLAQADIHNFLARLALDAGDRAEARRHAEIGRERAWCDGPPHCYRPALDEAERLLGEI